MGDRRRDQEERMMRYAHLIEKQTGKAVRPFRADGYVNLLNRYGTQQDTTERYRYQAEPMVQDELLTMYYEGNGLFAKIIDTPAEEAIKHGFHLEGLKDQKVEDFFIEALDELDWEETAMTAIRWARLFGGSIAVMLINDGRGLEEPLDWRSIRSIDDIRVYDRSVIQPEEWSMFSYDPQDPFRTRGSRLGMPERYHINSRYGSFVVHDSRCLVFQNGILPENTTSSVYQLWGMPEYVRIQRAIRDAEIAHGSATKLLDRSVQAVYKMKDLAAELATEEGEDRVLRRLQTIDMARGLLNSITIDSEGEDYDFRQFQFSGVSDVIDSTCNFLSALTSIPQTILFGRSPAGMNSTGDADLENWYNALERIQKRMVKKNLRYLLSVVFQAGVRTGEVDEVPKIKIAFNPLWSLSDMEQADLEQKRAQTQLTRAQTAQIYMDKQVIDPSETRKKLADSDEFDVESMLDEYDDEDLFAGMEDQTGGETPAGGNPEEMNLGGAAGTEGEAPEAAPAATKLPQDMSEEEKQQAARASQADSSDIPPSNTTDEQNASSVGVLVISDGKILTGTRHNDFEYGLICGPGGHIEPGETPTHAAFRETEEEFGISPKSMIPLGLGPKEPDTGLTPYLFLCTDYEGEPDCVDLEMTGATFRTMEELDELAASLFQPFADGLEILKSCIENALFFGDDGREMYDKLADSIGRAVNYNADDDDVDWITVNGTHTPIKDGEAIGGGKLKGMSFKNAKSQKKSESGKSSGSKREGKAPVNKSEGTSISGKAGELQSKVLEVEKSSMGKKEKCDAYMELLREAEPGTTFKNFGIEMIKTDNPNYPYAYLDKSGNAINASSEAYFRSEIEYAADKNGCLEFFDKGAQIQQRKSIASSMKESGEFSVSDSVHGERSGKITLASPEFGVPGDYVVFRNGNIGQNGMIFLSPKKETADSYASHHGGGNTGEYEIHLARPLVVNGETDVSCIRQAYEALHPGKTAVSGFDLTPSKWVSYDKANATALNSKDSDYDSVIYIVGGEPAEVQVSARKAKSDLVKTAEYTTTAWSRTGKTYEEAVMKGLIDESASDYKKVELKSDSEDDSNEVFHASAAVYASILANSAWKVLNNDGTRVAEDGGPGSGNFGHEGVPGKIGGSAPSGSKAAISGAIRSEVEKMSDEDKEDFAEGWLGVRGKERREAVKKGELDELIEEKLSEIDAERAKLAGSVTVSKAQSQAIADFAEKIRSVDVENNYSISEDGSVLEHTTGDETSGELSTQSVLFATVHNHPGTSVTFSTTDLEAFAEQEKMTSMTVQAKGIRYMVTKTGEKTEKSPDRLWRDYENGYSANRASEDRYDNLRKWLYLNAHKYGILYSEEETPEV